MKKKKRELRCLIHLSIISRMTQIMRMLEIALFCLSNSLQLKQLRERQGGKQMRDERRRRRRGLQIL